MAWPYHPDLLAVPVPRYTSYPTAAEFADTVGPADMAAALDSLAPGAPVSLYVHIPYCREICWYCGCSTGAANRAGRLAAYLDGLADEIALLAPRIGGRPISRIAFGGGSPNAIAPAQFDALLARLRQSFRCEGAVLSIELDPRGFDAAWAASIARGGITRASLGVQAFSAPVQAAIGRVQPYAHVARVTDMLRAAGVTSLNFDLMYGLPGQDMAALDDTLAATLSLAPERVAVFGYAHVPAMLPRQRRIDTARLPDAALRFRQAERAFERMTAAGYAAIGFDHFAQPEDAIAVAAHTGNLRRNFQGFTEDGAAALIGIGASAISGFSEALLQNEKNSGRWRMNVGAARFATMRGLWRTADDRARAAAIEALLTRGTADFADLGDAPAVAAALDRFADRGLASVSGAHVAILPAGLPYARVMAASFDAYRAGSAKAFSSAV